MLVNQKTCPPISFWCTNCSSRPYLKLGHVTAYVQTDLSSWDRLYRVGRCNFIVVLTLNSCVFLFTNFYASIYCKYNSLELDIVVIINIVVSSAVVHNGVYYVRTISVINHSGEKMLKLFWKLIISSWPGIFTTDGISWQ